MAGGAVGGFIGAFFALPAAAVVQAFLSTWSRRSETVESDRTQVNSPTQGLADRQHAAEVLGGPVIA